MPEPQTAELPLFIRRLGARSLILGLLFALAGMFLTTNAATAIWPRVAQVSGLCFILVAVPLILLAFFPQVRRSAVSSIRTRIFKLKRIGFEKAFSPQRIAVVTAAIAVYGGASSLWGNEIGIFTNHPRLHTVLKIGVSAILGLIAGITVLRERWKEESLAETEVLFKGFMKFVGVAVQEKINRYADKAIELPNSKVFEKVTHPVEQIRVIATEGAHFLETAFRASEEKVDFTVLEQKNNEEWRFLYHLKPWKHEDPNKLVAPTTCAYRVLESGEAVLHPSKQVAAAEGDYILGKRDGDGTDKKSDGSIYCSPLQIKCRGDNWKFVISIVSYGVRFCDPCDEVNELKTKALLKEITRRIELELYQRVIKGK